MVALHANIVEAITPMDPVTVIIVGLCLIKFRAVVALNDLNLTGMSFTLNVPIILFS